MDQSTQMILNDNQYELDNSTVNDQLTIICRICYDDDKTEKTIAPCNCVGTHAHVHVSCLEQWLSVSESSNCDICKYTYKTFERHLSLDECLRQKMKFWKFVFHFALMIIILFVWLAIVLVCLIRSYIFFIDDTDSDAWCNGLAMLIITFGMIVLLWFWTFNSLMYWKMWRHTNKMICLDQNNHRKDDDDTINIITEI